jgi:hypothetical protein
MSHLKLVRPVTHAARPIPGVSFLLDAAQIAFELPSDAPTACGLQEPTSSRAGNTASQHLAGTEPRPRVDTRPEQLADTAPGRPANPDGSTQPIADTWSQRRVTVSRRQRTNLTPPLVDTSPKRTVNLSPVPPIDNSVAPPKRNTKLKGDISELRVAVALTEAGYAVSKPLGENQRYDLIADDGKRLLRIQVKTGRLRGAVIVYSCCSSHGHRSKTIWSKPYFGQIDFLAVYCAGTGKVYMIPETELVATASHLRLTPPRNNMVKTIRWASRYELA